MRLRFLGREWAFREPKPEDVLPILNTVAEYQAEARAETPIIRFWGWHNSAILNPVVLNRRYERHCEFFAMAHKVQKAVMVGAVVVWASACAGFAFYYGTANAETLSKGTNPILEGLLAGGVGVVTGWSLCWVIRVFTKWNAAYGPAWIFERSDVLETWRTTGLLGVYLPRLAFVDSSEGDYFSGPTRESGPRTGIVSLELPVGARIADCRSITACYSMAASQSTFTEVPAREAYDLIQRAVAVGNLKRGLRKSKLEKLLADNWPWIVAVVNAIIIFFMTSSGKA